MEISTDTFLWVREMVATFLWVRNILWNEWCNGPIDRDRALALEYGLQARPTNAGTVMLGGISRRDRKIVQQF